MHDEHPPEEHEDEARQEREDGTLGAEKDHGDAAPLPFAPHEDDDSPLGDTDQHSTA